MQKRTNTQSSSLIIYISIITILIQFAVYYFIEVNILIWAAASLISLICCHVLIEHTLTYFSCLHYSFLSLFISVIIIALTYLGEVKTFLPYNHAMLGIALINWLVPLLHCFIRNMIDASGKIDDFYDYYKSNSIFFIIVYIATLIYGNYIADSFFWTNNYGTSANFSILKIISVKVEDYIYNHIPLSDIMNYLSSRILIYIPYGFYISLLLRNQRRLIKSLALLILPFVFKALQYFIIKPRCDIDDLFYAFIGGLIGTLIFFITNVIFRSFSGRDFFGDETRSRYFGNTLHF